MSIISVVEFSGGLNKETSPHLIGKAFATELRNLGIDNGSLTSKKYSNTKRLIKGSDRIKYYNNGYIIDVSSEDKPQYKGLKTVRFQDYEYLIHEGVVKQIHEDSLIDTRVDNSGISGSTIVNVDTPISAKAKTYTYYITYRNKHGFESTLHRLGELSESISGTSQTRNKLTFVAKAGHAVMLYRVGNTLKYPSLVARIDGTKVTTDMSSSMYSLSSNEFTFGCLDRFVDNVHPRPSASPVPTGLKYLAANKYGMAASKGNILYLSYLRPDAWEFLANLNLASEITGIANTGNSILVFTESGHLYQISGSNYKNLNVSIIREDIGCSSHKSIVRMRNGTIVWLYNKDVYIYNGNVVNLTRSRYKLRNSVDPNNPDNMANAVSLDNKYIMGTNDGLVIIDFNLPNTPIIEYNLKEVIENDLIINFFSNLQVFTYMNKLSLGFYTKDNAFWLIEELIFRALYSHIYIGSYDKSFEVKHTSYHIYIGMYPGGVLDTSEAYLKFGDFGGKISQGDIRFSGFYRSPSFTNVRDGQLLNLEGISIIYSGRIKMDFYIEGKLIFSKEVTRDGKGVSVFKIPSSVHLGSYFDFTLSIEEIMYGYFISFEEKK